MRKLLFIIGLLFIGGEINAQQTKQPDFIIAFGSCNQTALPNVLWDDVLKNAPNVWIWGGDNVYADTKNMTRLRKQYNKQLANKDYKKLIESTEVMGTWDDHDYGLNDGGEEFSKKRESQQELLEFLQVAKNNKRRKQDGVYASKTFTTPKGSIKIIVLDTRFFRTALTPDKDTKKRYKPNKYGEGTVLGNTQWEWLEQELTTSAATFNVLVSSIQLLSNKHGFETWGNFPHEVDRLEKLIINSKAKGVVVLSGDRHISEFSKKHIKGLSYPLIDFTSSGLTHAYSSFSGEDNPYRVGDVVNTVSFGLLSFNFDTKEVHMEIKGNHNLTLQSLKQTY